MGYVDPKEGDAITAALNWAQDHGFVSEHRTLHALIQAVATIAPNCDSTALQAYINEYAATEDVSIFALAFAPPFEPLSAGEWRAGPITGSGHQKGIVLVGIFELEQLARLRGRAQ